MTDVCLEATFEPSDHLGPTPPLRCLSVPDCVQIHTDHMILQRCLNDIFVVKCHDTSTLQHCFRRCLSAVFKPSSGAVQAASRQRERSGQAHKARAPAEVSAARSPPLLSSAGASSLLGLIKPTDPLLLIDFLIINSVCPSISLRRRISPNRAKVLLCYLPASGYQRANIDHAD